jgi:hypothetical protein
MKIKEFKLHDIGKLVQIRTFGSPILEDRIPITSLSDKPRYITKMYFLAKVDGKIQILKMTKGLWTIFTNPTTLGKVAYIKIGNIDDMLTYTLEEITADVKYEIEDQLRIETIHQKFLSATQMIKELNNGQ